MLQWEHSALLSTFIKLQFVIKSFVLSIFQVLLYTCYVISEVFLSLSDNRHIPRYPVAWIICLGDDDYMGLSIRKPGHEVIKLFSCSTEHEISTAHKN